MSSSDALRLRWAQQREVMEAGRQRAVEARVKLTPKATVSPTTRDLEWAAGFLEGEGTFRNTGIMVPQVNREPLDRLQALFGGNVKLKTARERRQPTWYWYVCGRRARGVMMTLYSLLSEVRRAQIRRALGHVN